MKWLAAALAVAILLLQYRIWLSADGVHQVTQLHQAVAAQRGEVLGIRHRGGAAEATRDA